MSTITPANVPTQTSAVAPQPSAHKQIPTTEAAHPASEATEVKEELLSPKFAAMARKEKMIRQRELALKAREAEVDSLVQSKQAEFEQSWKAKLAADPISVMNESGLSYDQLTQLMLNQPGPQDQKILALEKEIRELKGDYGDLKKAGQDSLTQQREQAKIQIGKEISRLVQKSESFEAIQASGPLAEQAVVELIEQHFDQSGEILDYDVACQQVEDHLIEEGMKYARLKKIQAKLLPPQSEQAPEAQKLQEPQKPLNTLSNRMSQVTQQKPMTARERRDRAVAAFLGQLK